MHRHIPGMNSDNVTKGQGIGEHSAVTVLQGSSPSKTKSKTVSPRSLSCIRCHNLHLASSMVPSHEPRNKCNGNCKQHRVEFVTKLISRYLYDYLNYVLFCKITNKAHESFCKSKETYGIT